VQPDATKTLDAQLTAPPRTNQASSSTIAERANGLLANQWVTAGLIFGLTRAVALAGAYSGVSLIMSAEPARNKAWFVELGLMWDATWYAGLVQNHYVYDPALQGGSNVSYAPLYPFLLWLVSGVLGWITFGWDWGDPNYGTIVAGGFLISNVAFFFALALLIQLLRPRFGWRGASLVALGLASLPLALFFSAIYTEGLFLLLVVGAFLVARSSWPNRWLLAGLLGMLASLDKFAGALLFPALAVEYMSQRGWSWRKVRADAAWLALIPAGILLFLGFLWFRFGSPWVLNDSMLKGWDHKPSFFLGTYWESGVRLWESFTGTWTGDVDPVLYYGNGSRLYLILDLLMPIALIAGAALAWRHVRSSEWTFLVLGLIYPLSTNITFSLARYMLPLWPGLIWLGTLRGRARWVAGVLIVLSLGMLFWCSRIYGSARWIG
jgi:hypothetical protein